MSDNKAKQIIDTILAYLSNPQTYQVIMTMLVAFGVKIEAKLQAAITQLGIAIADLGKAIENLVLTIQELHDVKKIEAKK